MTDYRSSNNLPSLRKLVPPQAKHIIEGSATRIDGTSMRGRVKFTGSRLRLSYVEAMQGVGDVKVDYTFIINNGIMVAKTLPVKVSPWDIPPDRTAEYIINGHCTLR
jgi:hypothetical protein